MKTDINMKMRRDLMAQLRGWITDRGLSQNEAANLLSTSQPRISSVMNADTDCFSVEMLINLLSRAGFKVTIVLRLNHEIHS